MKNFIYAAIALLVGIVAHGQELSVSTNVMDYVNLGTMNVEASYGFARHWSLDAGVKYNPFSFGEGENAVQNRQRTFTAGARYWPWHIYSGWWLSCAVRYQEYNSGGFKSPETSEGNRFGSAFKGGYSYMLSTHVNLDLGLGLWMGYDIYRTYACPRCGRVLAEGAKYFVLPSDFIVSLSYIF